MTPVHVLLSQQRHTPDSTCVIRLRSTLGHTVPEQSVAGCVISFVRRLDQLSRCWGGISLHYMPTVPLCVLQLHASCTASVKCVSDCMTCRHPVSDTRRSVQTSPSRLFPACLGASAERHELRSLHRPTGLSPMSPTRNQHGHQQQQLACR